MFLRARCEQDMQTHALLWAMSVLPHPSHSWLVLFLSPSAPLTRATRTADLVTCNKETHRPENRIVMSLCSSSIHCFISHPILSHISGHAIFNWVEKEHHRFLIPIVVLTPEVNISKWVISAPTAQDDKAPLESLMGMLNSGCRLYKHCTHCSCGLEYHYRLNYHSAQSTNSNLQDLVTSVSFFTY